MKRILFLLAGLMMILSMSALVQKPPFDPYFTDISFDAKTYKLSFTDTYKATEAVDRNYTIEFYFRTTDTEIIVASTWYTFYTYGAEDGTYFISTTVNDSEGTPIPNRLITPSPSPLRKVGRSIARSTANTKRAPK